MRKTKHNGATVFPAYGLAVGIALGTAAPLTAGTLAPLPALPDPTRPVKTAPRTTDDEPSRLELQSTLVSGARRTAVINGHLRTVGSRINGAKIVDIQPGRVLVRRDGRDVTLHLIPSPDRVRDTGAEDQ